MRQIQDLYNSHSRTEIEKCILMRDDEGFDESAFNALQEYDSLRLQLSASNDAVEGEFISLHTKITELTVKLAASEAAREKAEKYLRWTFDLAEMVELGLSEKGELHMTEIKQYLAALTPQEGEG